MEVKKTRREIIEEMILTLVEIRKPYKTAIELKTASATEIAMYNYIFSSIISLKKLIKYMEEINIF